MHNWYGEKAGSVFFNGLDTGYMNLWERYTGQPRGSNGSGSEFEVMQRCDTGYVAKHARNAWMLVPYCAPSLSIKLYEIAMPPCTFADTFINIQGDKMNSNSSY